MPDQSIESSNRHRPGRLLSSLVGPLRNLLVSVENRLDRVEELEHLRRGADAHAQIVLRSIVAPDEGVMIRFR